MKTTGLDLEAKLDHEWDEEQEEQEVEDGPGKRAEMSNENLLNELNVTR